MSFTVNQDWPVLFILFKMETVELRSQQIICFLPSTLATVPFFSLFFFFSIKLFIVYLMDTTESCIFFLEHGNPLWVFFF